MNMVNLTTELFILEKRYQLIKDYKVNILGPANLKKNMKLQVNIKKDQSIMMKYGYI